MSVYCNVENCLDAEEIFDCETVECEKHPAHKPEPDGPALNCEKLAILTEAEHV